MEPFEIIREVFDKGASFSVKRQDDRMVCQIVNGAVLPPDLIEKVKANRDKIIWSLTAPYRIVLLAANGPTAGVQEVLWEGKEWEWDLHWPLLVEKWPEKMLAVEYLDGSRGWIRSQWSLQRAA